MKRAQIVKTVALMLATSGLLVGCAAANGVNQLLNNVIGTTAGTMAKAVNMVVPPAQSAQTTYSQFKTAQEYNAEQAKKAAAYDREHRHDKYYQSTANGRKNRARRLGTPQQPKQQTYHQPRFTMNQPPQT